MKVVMHLMSTHSFSGAENVACQIINSFKNENNYKMVYVSEIKENKNNLEDRNIKYYRLNKFNYYNVRKAIKELKPDIIHAHDIKASVLASLFHKKAYIISHIHANHENMRKKTLKALIFSQVSKNLKTIIWVSKSALDNYFFKTRVADRSVVLYNAIDSNEIKQKILLDVNNYPEYDIIYLGRLSYQKNPMRLANIIKCVKEINDNIRVAFVGDGELMSQLTKYISKYNLERNIKLYGFVKNPYKILQQSKIMLMTSRYEGTPMCALEALSLGKPIISTPTDGLIEIIENGLNGFISNSDDEIVNQIIQLLSEPDKLESMNKNAINIFEKISNMDEYKRKLNKIYNLSKG